MINAYCYYISQFIRKVCGGIKEAIKPGAHGISLIKVQNYSSSVTITG